LLQSGTAAALLTPQPAAVLPLYSSTVLDELQTATLGQEQAFPNPALVLAPKVLSPVWLTSMLVRCMSLMFSNSA
jgi:hypothetical protein